MQYVLDSTVIAFATILKQPHTQSSHSFTQREFDIQIILGCRCVRYPTTTRPFFLRCCSEISVLLLHYFIYFGTLHEYWTVKWRAATVQLTFRFSRLFSRAVGFSCWNILLFGIIHELELLQFYGISKVITSVQRINMVEWLDARFLQLVWIYCNKYAHSMKL